MKPLVILRVSDGVPGHEAQSEGLAKALAHLTHCNVFDVPTFGLRETLCSLILGRPLPVGSLPRPDVIICCGHRTHLSGIALRRRLGGRIVTLMTPSLPSCLFDLVVSPRHDGLREKPSIILSEGVLNALDSAGTHQRNRGLFLIGGPSRHHFWDQEGLFEQIRAVAEADKSMHWTLSTSRRTPASLTNTLAQLHLMNVEIVPFEQTGAGWVAGQFASCSTAWITEDSVSMVYEALTAGVAVGLLSVPRVRNSRVSRGLDALVAKGLATAFDRWRQVPKLEATRPLAEADRVAREIMKRWYPRP